MGVRMLCQLFGDVVEGSLFIGSRKGKVDENATVLVIRKDRTDGKVVGGDRLEANLQIRQE
jgi:hypothetical protein